ncbi:MAG: hypothetical protein H6502_03560 [Candidatus Woesearchaeota archaeon]|nr:MAG: hypothetical protein H6502_03560 [Candidatus Woesearchaeota archaeon]
MNKAILPILLVISLFLVASCAQEQPNDSTNSGNTTSNASGGENQDLSVEDIDAILSDLDDTNSLLADSESDDDLNITI